MIPARKELQSTISALGLTLVSCAAEAPPPEPPPPPVASRSPEAVLDAIRDREARVRTFRARVSVRRGASPALDGVLVVAKPDRVRLRLSHPLGMTAMDLLARGDDVVVTAPGEGAVPLDDARLHAELLAVLARGGEAFPGQCDARREGDRVVVECRRDGQPVRRLVVDPAREVIVREEAYDDRGLRFRTRHEDFVLVDGFPVPEAIVFEDLRRDLTLRIRARGHEINPELPDSMFRLPDSAR